MFASRTNWKRDTNPLSLLKKKLEDQGVPVLDLTESNPTHCEFAYLNGMLLRAFADPRNFSYEPSPHGLEGTRQAISSYYQEKGIRVSPKQIFLTASTSEAYSFIFRLLCNPGDHVLVPRPSYPLFDFLGDINDVILDPYRLSYEGTWKIDALLLQKTVGPETKAILFVNPNNPTSSFVKQDELASILPIAKEKDLAFIADEVFSNFALSPARQRVKSFAEIPEVLTFTLEGISKTLGLPQMKLAWIVLNGPPALVKEATARLEIICDTYLSVSTPVQYALPIWLAEQKEIHKEISGRLIKNLNLLKKTLEAFPMVTLLEPEAGWYAVLRIPRVQSEEAWCLEILAKDHILVHPGFFFDFEEEAYLVVSLLPPAAVFQEGLQRLLTRIKMK